MGEPGADPFEDDVSSFNLFQLKVCVSKVLKTVFFKKCYRERKENIIPSNMHFIMKMLYFKYLMEVLRKEESAVYNSLSFKHSF